MKTSLRDVIDRTALRKMAGAQSYSRGQDYYDGEQVDDLNEYEGVITARVMGTSAYKVKLWMEKETLEHSCSCPMGDAGHFCKHCVAVGLTWLDEKQETKTKSAKTTKPSVTLDDAKEWLQQQDKKTLVEMLLKQVMEDERLRRDILLKTAKSDSKKGVNIDAYRSAIKCAVNDCDDYVDYHSMHGYVRGIDDAVDGIDGLLKEGYTDEVIGLAEYALRQIETALESADDSDGYMSDLLGRLQEIHLIACKKSQPEPEALARRLFDWELHAQWDIFHGAAQTYANILGEKGLVVYRKLAETEWAKIPPLSAGQDRSLDTGRYHITSIMESLARQSGDVEELVSVLKKDLSSGYAYFKIAEIYKEAKNPDLALEWAERGLKAFPQRTDSRLREFAANEYLRRKRPDDGMNLIWQEFEERASLTQYKKLKEYADRIDQWPSWREKAIAFMREEIAKSKIKASKGRWDWSPVADASALVEIFLWEKDVENAWREARQNGCSTQLWLELARKREAEHPAEALPIYQARIEPTIEHKNNDAYREAIRYLHKVEELMGRLDQQGQFKTYMELLRVKHKPKRNFIKLLDGGRV